MSQKTTEWAVDTEAHDGDQKAQERIISEHGDQFVSALTDQKLENDKTGEEAMGGNVSTRFCGAVGGKYYAIIALLKIRTEKINRDTEKITIIGTHKFVPCATVVEEYHPQGFTKREIEEWRASFKDLIAREKEAMAYEKAKREEDLAHRMAPQKVEFVQAPPIIKPI